MGSVSPLASVAATRDVLARHGLEAKYTLGQNFLVNDDILAKIVHLADLQPTDDVLEVGPGIGTLTIALLGRVNRVAAVERDPAFPAVLVQTCAQGSDRLAVICKDALDLARADVPFSPNKLVSNLPYAVAATVVLDYLQRFGSLQSATVMVQKEVADRMAAVPGTKNYGAYTVKLSLHARPVGRFEVGPRNFYPAPRVDSAVVRLDRAACRASMPDGAPVPPHVVAAASMMADAAFANRRKTLANSCKTYFAGRGEEGAFVASVLPKVFQQAGIDPRRRGETLDVAEFVHLGAALAEIDMP